MKKIVALLLSAAMLIGTAGCGKPKERGEKEIIRDIVTYYGSYGGQSREKVEQLLTELEQKDSRQGQLWKGIMDYWAYVDDEMEINTDTLPDDLSDASGDLAIVVLGYELNPDGTMKNELLQRLDVGLKCALQYENAYVVCTGGGTASGNKKVTEAGLMAEWLKDHGVKENRLIVENQSFTTAQNALYSYAILSKQYPQVRSVVIVSSDYHIPWGSLMFETVFRQAASEDNAPELHVVSHSACVVENQYDMLPYETGGMLELLQEGKHANRYYSHTYSKPKL